MTGWSVRSRLVATTGLVATLTAVALVLILQVVLDRSSTAQVASVLAERADDLVEGSQAAGAGLDTPADVLAPGVAVYNADGDLIAGAVPASLRATYERVRTVTTERRAEIGEAYALLARPLRINDFRGTVVLTEPIGPYETGERSALVASGVVGAVMVALATAVAAAISRRALAPVETMARTARDWSEHDLDRRFGLGAPTDEIRALGRTLDGLLDRVARVIRAEQRLTAELAHELRSPLTAIRGTADLAAMRADLDDELREDLATIIAASDAMATAITTLLDLARRESLDDLDGACTGPEIAHALRTQHADRRLAVDLPDDLILQVPVALAVRALGPVIDNALVAGHTVRVSSRSATEAAVEIHVTDDGPGRPRSTDEPAASGTGLGLPLARRVAHSVGGDIWFSDAAPGLTTVVVRLPAHRSIEDRSP